MLNRGQAADAFRFDPKRCTSPLPRAYQWADGSAYVNHVELVRKARGAEMPPSFWTDPLMYQGGSDSFVAPHDAILAESEDWGSIWRARSRSLPATCLWARLPQRPPRRSGWSCSSTTSACAI